MSNLPIEPLLPEICQTLRRRSRLVLAAPPGAGKTSRVPLALAGLLEGFESLPGKVVVLEPRRIAARMAAERMAETLSEKVGQTIGLSTRIDRRVSNATRVEVITDGLFIRRLLANPELGDISAVIFDEIHERGLNTDLGLALALDAQAALREDLLILAMSATLDTASVASKIDAPVIESQGRQYPVETRYVGRTRDRIEDQMAKAIARGFRETDGSILAFLPGAGEIKRTAERLNLPGGTLIAPLYGALSPREQDAAVSKCQEGQRKVVLATDIAESALTIDGVSTVIDSGLSRVPDGSVEGQNKLITVRASHANVDQRRGRAGRLGPGTCYRLWDEAETRGLMAAPEPEILRTDLSGLLLTLAEWGERNPDNLIWLSRPPAGRIAAARQNLQALGALDEEGSLTSKGRAMVRLPLSPRFSALIVSAETPEEKALAARIAALASEVGIGGASADLKERLERFERDTSQRAKALRRQSDSWCNGATPRGDPAAVLAKGWPDRLAKRRTGSNSSYIIANGSAGQLDETSPLAKSKWLVVADMIGSAKTARITLAAPIEANQVLKLRQPEEREDAVFDASSKSFKARRIKAFGAIVLSETPMPKPSGAVAKAAFLKHLKEDGFAPTGLEDAINALIKRLSTLHSLFGDPWPQMSLQDLQDSVETWLGPALPDRKFEVPSGNQVLRAYQNTLDWPLSNDLETKTPIQVELPSGRKARIDWIDERAPLIDCKVQELYGATRHIMLCDGRLPVTLQMLSPGGKPVATTQDLPGFWSGGYIDMAKDMRGRYPKHDWPQYPASAKPHHGMTKARLAKQ